MNEEEGEALTGEKDPLLAADKALEWVDLVLCTAGPVGLYMAGYVDQAVKRETELPLLPGNIAEFNKYEFSRAMRQQDCDHPLRVYSHIGPYLGGPLEIKIPMAPAMAHCPPCCTTWQQTATTFATCRIQPNMTVNT